MALQDLNDIPGVEYVGMGKLDFWSGRGVWAGHLRVMR